MLATLLFAKGVAMGADAVPATTLSAPSSVLLGSQFSFSASFANGSSSQAGYGPFVDIAVPTTGFLGIHPGTNAATAYDGIAVASSGAVTYLGEPLTYSVITLNNAANGSNGVAHPFALTASGAPVYLKTTDAWLGGRFKEGDQVVTVRLPFGSFTPSQPACTVSISAQLSTNAIVGSNYVLSARGGFQYGNDALNNPLDDPSLVGNATSTATRPTAALLKMAVGFDGPEGETATGPNFLRNYSLNLQVAPGQTVSNLTLVHVLPNDMQFVRVSATQKSGTNFVAVTNGLPSTTSPGGTISMNFGSVTGKMETDASLTFEFFEPRLNALNSAILAASSGNSAVISNQAFATAFWNPVDTRAMPMTVSVNETNAPFGNAEGTFAAKSIALQKSVAIVSNTGAAGYTPGDTVEYTLQFQVSDYFAFTNLVLIDVLSDGQRFDTNFTPTLSVTQHGVSTSGNIQNANFTVAPNFTANGSDTHLANPPADGTTTNTFRISAELSSRSWNGRLLGGGVTNGMTGLHNNTVPMPGTIGTLKFRAVIQDRYSDNFPSGEPALDPRDPLSATASISGNLLNVNNLTSVGSIQSDGSGVSYQLASSSMAVSIYAINGNTSYGSLNIHPGDTVTYRLLYNLPNGDVENLKFGSFLPLPVFLAAEMSGAPFSATISATAPPAGTAKFGPSETLYPIKGQVPAMSIDVANGNNTVFFNYGTVSNALNDFRRADILFTVTASTNAFADGLLLANQVQGSESGTFATAFISDVMQTLTLSEPVVSIHHGVVGFKDTGFTLGGITFAAPSNSVSSFSGGTISSLAMASAIDASDLMTNAVDAADRVRFATIAVNAGRSDAYGVTFTNTIPTGFVTPVNLGSLNLTLRRGDGTLMVNGVDYTASLIGRDLSVTLLDNYSSGNVGGDSLTGGLSRGHDAAANTAIGNGSSVVVATFDLTLDSLVKASETLTSGVALTRFSNVPNGINFVLTPATATALLNVKTPALAKTLSGTEINLAGNSNTQAVVGELVTYQATLTIPEGVTPGATLVDSMAAGLAFVEVVSVNFSSGVTAANVIGTGTNPSNVTIGSSGGGTGNTLSFQFGDITNVNTGNTANTVTIVYRAVVVNSLLNQAGSQLAGTATLSHTSGNAINSVPAAVTVIEPTLAITSLVSTNNINYASTVSTLQAGDQVYFRMIVTNAVVANGATAFDLFLSNALPVVLQSPSVVSVTAQGAGTVLTNDVAATGTLNPSLFQLSGNTLSISSGNTVALQTNSAVVVVVTGSLPYTVNPNQGLTNVTTVRWSSMKGAVAGRSVHNAASNERTGGSLTPNTGVNASTNDTILENYAATSGNVIARMRSTILANTLLGSEVIAGNNGATQATPGEMVSYELRVTVPQGVTVNARITNALPAGLALVDVTNVTASPNVTMTQPIGTGTTPANVTVNGFGRFLSFNMGDVTNLDSNAAVAETISISYRAVVLNTLNNQAGSNLVNSGTFICSTVGNTNVQSAGLVVVEPSLDVQTLVSTDNISYNSSISSLQAGDPIYFRLVVTNAPGALRTTAHDIVLSNAVPAEIQNPTVIGANVTGTGSVITNGVSASGAIHAGMFTFNGNTLTVGTNAMSLGTNAAVTVIVQGEMGYSVTPGQQLQNNVTVQWSSLNGIVASRSVHNSSESGERHGASLVPVAGVNASTNNAILNNYAATSGSAVSAIVSPLLSVNLAGTSWAAPGNLSTQATVGELVTYTITVTVPQGVTPDLTLSNTLPAGVAFVDVTGVITSPGLSVEQPVGTGTTPANVSISGSGQYVVFSMGDVSNNDTSSGTVETITITYRGAVLNVLGNQTGVSLTNSVRLAVTGWGHTDVSGAAVGVVEPTLWVTTELSANNVTYGSSLSGVDAGNTIYMRLIVTNAAPVGGQTTTAYDLSLTNTLPAGFVNPALVSVSKTGNGNLLTNGVVASGSLETSLFGLNGNVLSAVEAIALETNSAITVTVSAVMDQALQPAAQLASSTLIRWSSLPGNIPAVSIHNPASTERTGGALSPAIGVNASTNNLVLENYAARSGNATATVTAPVFSSGVLATDDATTSGNNVVIGEVVTYRVTVSLPEGTTPNLSVTNIIPAGMAFVPGSVQVQSQRPASGIHASHPGTGGAAFGGSGETAISMSPASLVSGTVVFNFGTIVVNGDNDLNNNTFSLTFQVVVMEFPANVGIQGAQTILANSFSAGAGFTSASVLADPAGNSVTVVEPRLSMAQSMTINGNASLTRGDQGDAVTVRLTLQHSGTSLANAYDVAVTNALPAVIGASAVSDLTMANVVITNNAGADISGYFVLSGGILQTTNSSTLTLPLGDRINIVVNGILKSSGAPGQTYPNNASFSYSSRDGSFVAPSFDPNPSATSDRERILNGSGSGAGLLVNSNALNGAVFADVNGSISYDAGDNAISGVTITLTGVDNLGNPVLLDTATSIAGTFGFASLKPGVYTLSETPPGNYLASIGVAGTPFGGSSNSEHAITNIVIAAGSNSSGNNYNFVTPLNQSPQFDLVTNLLQVAQDAGPQSSIGFLQNISVGPANESTQSVEFIVSNNNSNLFQVQPTITANGTLTFQSIFTSNGVATVTVVAKDDGGTAGGGNDTSAAQMFTIRILSNQPPAFTLGANPVSVLENAGNVVSNNWAAVTGGGAGEFLQSVTNYVVSNNNNPLFAVQPSLALDGTLSFTPAAYSNGTAIVSVYVQDNGGTAGGGTNLSAVQTFTITVQPVNQPPTFVGGSSLAVNQNPGAQAFAGWATGVSVGPENESSQTFASEIVSISDPSLFVTDGLPSIAPDGTLTFTNANANGTATIGIRLRDNGGTDNGGNDTSGIHTFNIQVGTDALVKATGGEAMSADDVAAVRWTSLSGPSYTEGGSGDVGAGTIVLNAPAGFAFNPSVLPVVVVVTNYADGITASVTNSFPVTSINSSQIVFTATDETRDGSTISLLWGNIQVMPTNAVLPAAGILVGEITYSGTGSLRDVTKGSDSLGTLVEVPGLAVAMRFVEQPWLEQSGVPFVDQAVVRSIDAAGNYTANVNHLIPAETVVELMLIGGPGVLSGTRHFDITANPGVISAFNQEVNMAGTNWQLVASNNALGVTTSEVFIVESPFSTPPPLSTNGMPHGLLSDAGPIGLWLANLRGDKYPWYTPGIGLLWRDLVVANYNSNIITVRLCKDDGTFENPVTYPTDLNPFAVRSGFYSDSTHEDVAIGNFGTNTLSVFKSYRDGTGRLHPRVDYVVGSTPNPGPISIASAKHPGIRHENIFVANSNECTVSVLRNYDGTFLLETNIPVGLNPTSVQAKDIDGDSIPDLLTANQGDNTLSILRGQTNFTFVPWKTISFPGNPQPSYALSGDVNGDGVMDLVVANYGANSVSILLQSAGEFSVSTNYAVGTHPQCILLRDLNRDGILDIAIANYDGASVDILIGRGNGAFERAGRLPVGRNPMCIVGSNFNGDSATDIAVSNFGDDTISLYLYSGPLARNLTVSTMQNVPVSIALKGEILGGDSLAYALVSQPTNGTLSGTPPNLVYTPAANYFGADSFEYRTYHTNYAGPERFQFQSGVSGFITNYPSPVATVSITVKPRNQAPSFTLSTNRIVVPSSASLQIISNFAVNISAGSGEEDQTVKFVTGSGGSFYSVAPSVSTNGTLTFQPAHLAVGTNTVGIKLQDDGSTANGGSNVSPMQYFDIVVLPNQAPAFVLSTNYVNAAPFAPNNVIPGFAVGISAGQGEAAQSVTFVVTTTNSSFFAVAPTVTTSGTLSFAPAWSALGTNYVSIQLRDNGSTKEGGTNLSSAQQFAVVVPDVGSPFVSLKSSTFTGLFSDTNAVSHHSAGFLTVTVSPKAGFSGKLYVDGNAVAFSGKFSPDGTGTVVTRSRRARFDKDELTIYLALQPSQEKLVGSVAENSRWTAQLLADRYVWTTNIADQATSFTNRYTMIIPGFSISSEGPMGDGYGLVVVDRLGRIKASGAMGDGMALKQGTLLSRDGYWPFFAPGYKTSRINAAGKTIIETEGFVLGWLQFATNAHGNMAPEGDLHWIKTGWTNSTYAGGFTNLQVEVTGSRWLAPLRSASIAAVDMTNVVVDFDAGDLGPNLFSASFLMKTNTTLVVESGVINPNSARTAVAPKTGLFKGTFVHPVTMLPTRFSGVLLQDYNIGRGYFMGATESGTVEMRSAD